MSTALKIIPTGESLGAEIADVDLTQSLTREQVEQVRAALLDYGVVFFRNQHISEPDQVRFTGYFGRPVEHVRKQRPRPVPEIFIISNVEENGKPIGALGHGEVSFHSDLSYLRQPGTLSVLYAVEIPQEGGQTQWCNCSAAYAELDNEIKDRIDGLRAVHRHYVEEQNPPETVDHPVVRTHPETGRKSLYVGPHLTKHIVGMHSTESADLLALLYAHLEQPRFIWTHEWQIGDLVLWDNRPTMHRRLPFPSNQRRLMKRTQVFNDEIPI
ncbi:MAG: taurine catabolism dioxygenase TauD [Gemmatimonadetes bacterium]|nr:taurine catabolism dioxygenase TauD [Gemmatimonadota bacterium]|tara:strand:- start:155 stop:964 length:810 start_codon:yes stop_codon:yes gene_type:complete